LSNPGAFEDFSGDVDDHFLVVGVDRHQIPWNREEPVSQPMKPPEGTRKRATVVEIDDYLSRWPSFSPAVFRTLSPVRAVALSAVVVMSMLLG
jgi:hypothetical protein